MNNDALVFVGLILIAGTCAWRVAKTPHKKTKAEKPSNTKRIFRIVMGILTMAIPSLVVCMDKSPLTTTPSLARGIILFVGFLFGARCARSRTINHYRQKAARFLAHAQHMIEPETHASFELTKSTVATKLETTPIVTSPPVATPPPSPAPLPAQQVIGTEQLAILESRIAETGTSTSDVLRHYKITTLADLSILSFDDAIRILSRKSKIAPPAAVETITADQHRRLATLIKVTNTNLVDFLAMYKVTTGKLEDLPNLHYIKANKLLNVKKTEMFQRSNTNFSATTKPIIAPTPPSCLAQDDDEESAVQQFFAG